MEATVNGRIRQLPVSCELLLSLLGQGKPATAVTNALPDDARIVGTLMSPETGTVNLLIHSETFSPVPMHLPIPEIEASPRHTQA